MQVNVSVKNGSEEFKNTFEFQTGETLADAVELFGQEIVKTKFDQKVRIEVADRLRLKVEKLMEGDENNAPVDFEEAWETATKTMQTWKPGQATPRKSADDKLGSLLAGLEDATIEAIAAKRGIDADILKEIRDAYNA